MMGNRVVVTGIGAMCAIGNNAQEVYENMIHSVTGISDITLFNADKLRSKKAGQIKKDIVYRVREFGEKSRLEYIIEALIKELLEDSGLAKEDFEDLYERCIFSMATSVGTNTQIIEFEDDKKNDIYIPERLTEFPKYIFEQISNTLGICGAYYVNTSACSAGTTAAGTAFSKIREGAADMAVVLGVDPMTEFSEYGFNSMKNISTEVCRPFDAERDGINLGEGGAILLLESYEHAVARNAKIYAEIYGYGLGNDAYHRTSPEPTGMGAYRTMKMALEDAGIPLNMVDYINAHGTGTIQNDSMEILGADKIFEHTDNLVYMSSTKSMTGHCLAAAGTIELFACVLSVFHDMIYGNATLNIPENTQNIQLVGKECLKKKVRCAISNSFAFAGNSASIVIGKQKEILEEI